PGQNRGETFESFDAFFDVRVDHVGELIPGLTGDHSDDRPNGIDQFADCAGQGIVGLDVFDRRLTRAAPAVAQHHDEPHSQLGDCVFDASFDGWTRPTDDVARDAD